VTDPRSTDYFRERAEREIALAKATGSKAHASPDFRTVFIERRDGTRESIRLPEREKRN
jgi:hypothetical protein